MKTKVKIKWHKRSCWLVLPEPSSCVQVISDCRLQSDEPPHGEREHLNRSALTGRREETTHLSASSLIYITGQPGFTPLRRFTFHNFYKTMSRTFFLNFPALKTPETLCSERIHPVQFEFVAGQVGSGLQAVAFNLLFGHEHGDGTTFQEHFHITFL